MGIGGTSKDINMFSNWIKEAKREKQNFTKISAIESCSFKCTRKNGSYQGSDKKKRGQRANNLSGQWRLLQGRKE